MSGGLHSLATIIKRLEATTSRLEDLTTAWDKTYASHGAALTGEQPSAHAHQVSMPVDSSPSQPPPSAVPRASLPQVPPSVAAFDDRVIQGKLQPFLELTRSLAVSPVVEQAQLFEKELQDLRSLLETAAACQQPDQAALSELLAPLQADIEAIARLRETNRKERDWANHMMVLSEGAPCVGWVAVSPKPGPHIKEIHSSVMFYGNRIMTQFKGKDTKHVEWVNAYAAILEEMRLYVVEHHATGLSWNQKGVSVAQYKASVPTAASPAPPPPPPPPPPAPSAPPAAVNSLAPIGGVAAVFADLNRGEEVTKGLRKVDKSEMTHKNPSLRAAATAPTETGSKSSPKRPQKPTKPQSLTAKKPSKFVLEGNKWIIEYQENESNLVIEAGEKGQTVSLYGCKNSTLVIKGKVNAVTIANCIKMSILVQSVISAVTITNSPSFALQITGSAPTIQLDSTDSGQIYLSKEGLGVEIITSKCSSINVSLPVEGEEDGVFKELPIPEMLKTVVSSGALATSIIEHTT